MADQQAVFPFRINFQKEVESIILDVESVVRFEDGAIIFAPTIKVTPVQRQEPAVLLDIDFSNHNLLRYG